MSQQPWPSSPSTTTDYEPPKSPASTQLFFYPPLTPTRSERTTAPLLSGSGRARHPYQMSQSGPDADLSSTAIAQNQLYSHASATASLPDAQTSHTYAESQTASAREKQHLAPTFHSPVSAAGFEAGNMQGRRVPTPSVRTRSLQRMLVKVLIVLPLPTVLSTIQLVTGHGIMQMSTNSTTSPWRTARVQNSAGFGALGGIIIAPVILGIVFLLVLTAKPPERAPDDFFEDETDGGYGLTLESIGLLGRPSLTWWRYATIALIVIFVGAISGPIGSAALGGASFTDQLDPRYASLAGLIGGTVIFGASVLVLALALAALVILNKSAENEPPMNPSETTWAEAQRGTVPVSRWDMQQQPQVTYRR